MPFGTERKRAIRVPVSEVFKDILALPDIKTLAFQLADDGFGQLVQCKSRIFPSLSGRDHLPKQHPRQIVTRRLTSGLGLIPDILLADRLLCVALRCFFDSRGIICLLVVEPQPRCRPRKEQARLPVLTFRTGRLDRLQSPAGRWVACNRGLPESPIRTLATTKLEQESRKGKLR